MKEALVVITIGEKYKKEYQRNFFQSHQKFSQKNNLDIIIVSDYIEETSKHPSWQKLLIFRHPEVKKYERILLIDADIYITKQAENPLKEVPAGLYGATKNNAYNLASLGKSDPTLYDGMDNPPEFVLNGGFLILEKNIHQNMMEEIFYKYPERICFEQGPLSYHLLKNYKGVVLSSKFNTIITSYREYAGRGLSILREMYEENYFLHFASGINKNILSIIRFLDSREKKSFSYKMFSLISNKKLEKILTPIAQLLAKIN